MLPMTTAALVTAGGQAANGLLQGVTNLVNRRNSLKDYARQRADALSDWNALNIYNSPASQMQRYKDAGLNPNLIYGQTNQAAPVRSTSLDTPRGNAPQFDAGSVIGAYYDTALKGQQTDNLKTAQQVAQIEIELKKAQILATLAGAGLVNEKTIAQTMDNYVKKEIIPFTLEGSKVDLMQKYANLDKTYANTRFTDSQNYRANEKLKLDKMLTANTLANGVEERLTKRLGRKLTEMEMQKMLVVISNLQKSGAIMDYEISLNKLGVKGSDNTLVKVGAQISGILAENIGKSVGWLTEQAKKLLRYH